jgi:hypothetical protein
VKTNSPRRSLTARSPSTICSAWSSIQSKEEVQAKKLAAKKSSRRFVRNK